MSQQDCSTIVATGRSAATGGTPTVAGQTMTETSSNAGIYELSNCVGEADNFPLPPASQEDGDYPIVPPVIVAVPVKSRGRPKKPVTEEEKAAAEAVKAEKEAEKKAKEEEKAKKEAEKAAEKAKKDAEKAAKEAAKAEKDANKKPRGRPKKDSPTLSPTVPAHNPAIIHHLQEDVTSDASIIVALRAEIAALKEENARFSEIISSVCALVSL